ncbi:MAG: hypothetical protein WDO73_01035 [Ignavibacteriota bacterium]
MTILPLSIGLALLAAAPAFAVDPTCKLLADANAKIYAIPTHMYSTETASYTGGKTRATELIYLNDVTYISIGGKWTLSKTSSKQMAEMHKDAAAEHPHAVCRMVRVEAVNGEAATLYSMHEEVESAKVDSEIWLSKSRGVPLKVEMDTDVGGAAGKSHRSLRYEYTNVQAPAGVH